MGSGFSRLAASRRMQVNEAMTVAAITFLFSPLVMAYPMMGSGLAPGRGLDIFCGRGNFFRILPAVFPGKQVGPLSWCSNPGLSAYLTGGYAADGFLFMVWKRVPKGLDQVDISSVLKFGVRLFTINAGEDEAVTVEKLTLPESTRIIFQVGVDIRFQQTSAFLKKIYAVIIILLRESSVTTVRTLQ